MTRAAEVLDLARARGVMIATAESCTGGLVAAALTDIAGASDVFERGFVTYTNRSKTELLGVTEETLRQFGAVSEATALEMADGALRHSPADMAVSVTGIAGPGGTETKPEGRVCFAVAVRGRDTRSETVDFGALGRGVVRARSVEHALGLLHSALGALPAQP